MLLFFFFTSHLSLIFQHIFWSVIYVIIHFLKIGINEVKPNTDLEVFSLLEVREKPNWLLLSSKIAFINVIVSTLLLSSLYLYVLFFFFFFIFKHLPSHRDWHWLLSVSSQQVNTPKEMLQLLQSVMMKYFIRSLTTGNLIQMCLKFFQEPV